MKRPIAYLALALAAALGAATASLPAIGQQGGSTCDNTKCNGNACQSNQNGFACREGTLYFGANDFPLGCFPESPMPGATAGGTCCMGWTCGSGGSSCDPTDPEVACEQ